MARRSRLERRLGGSPPDRWRSKPVPDRERKLLPTIDMEFDIIMSAIGSNSPRYHPRKKNDVVCMFMRPSEADEAKVRDFLQFFNIPSDHVFRTG